MYIKDTSYTLFFTGGVSLKTWNDIGSLEREIEIYKRLSTHLKKVRFVTYGGKEDKNYSSKLGNIKIVPARWYNKRILTSLDLLLRHYPDIHDSDILKTNQIPGSEIPVWLKKKLEKKLITRCGYLHSEFIKRQTKDERTIREAFQLEKNAFTYADMGVVTSQRDRNYVIQKHCIPPEKIRVIPNYVNTDVFRPIPDVKKTHDLIYVGRAGSQKNIDGMLKALDHLKKRGRNVSIMMIGGCCQDNEVRQMIEKYGLDAELGGNVPNYELPTYLNQAKIFILPSFYEGHPKSLLEAMSCGLPCIGTDVAGIKEDINHMESGYLCNTDYKSMANSIEILLNDEDVQDNLGKKAREHILNNYSIDKVLEMELKVIQEVMS